MRRAVDGQAVSSSIEGDTDERQSTVSNTHSLHENGATILSQQ